MEIIEGKTYLHVLEVMERLKVSRSTVDRYLRKGKLECIELRGKIYIPEESYNSLFIPRKKIKLSSSSQAVRKESALVNKESSKAESEPIN